jgi:hypothetical protein
MLAPFVAPDIGSRGACRRAMVAWMPVGKQFRRSQSGKNRRNYRLMPLADQPV